MSTPMLSKLSTFFTTTLISIQSFLLWLFTFEPSPALHASLTVTPYPLSLDSEGRVIDISYHSTFEDGVGVNRLDPEGESTASGRAQGRRLRAVSAPVLRNGATGKVDLKATRQCTPKTKTKLGLTFAPDSVANPPVALAPKIPIEDRSQSIQPLSTVTNFASPGRPRKHKQTDVPSQCLGDAENKRNPVRVAPFKPTRTPLQPMSRYLNLSRAGATVKTSTYVANSQSLASSYPGPRRRSIVGRVPRAGTSPCLIDRDKPTPLELESGLACADARDDAVVDFAARVRSVFYKRRIDDDFESESVREVFNRDSIWNLGWSIFPLGAASDAASVDKNAKCDKVAFVKDEDGPMPRSLAPAPSKASSESSRPLQRSSSPDPHSDSSNSEASSDSFTVCSSSRTRPLQCLSSSELPYVCDCGTDTDTSTSGRFSSCGTSVSSSSCRIFSTSSSGGAFNDLLASLERKFPVKDWSELVGFESNAGHDADAENEHEEGYENKGKLDGPSPYGGIVEQCALS